MQRLLPEGVRAAANIGKIFTGAWQLMGFTFFCAALRDNPSLIERVFERVAAIQARLTERVIAHPVIGAVLHADDLAYFGGPMVNSVGVPALRFSSIQRRCEKYAANAACSTSLGWADEGFDWRHRGRRVHRFTPLGRSRWTQLR